MAWQEVLAKAQEEFNDARFEKISSRDDVLHPHSHYIMEYEKALGRIAESLTPVSQQRAKTGIHWPGNGKFEFFIYGTIEPHLKTQNMPLEYVSDVRDVMVERYQDGDLLREFPRDLLNGTPEFNVAKNPISLTSRFAFYNEPNKEGLAKAAQVLKFHKDFGIYFEYSVVEVSNAIRFTTLSAVNKITGHK